MRKKFGMSKKKWWQKEIKGWIVPFWYTDTPLYSKRAVKFSLQKLSRRVRKIN